MQDLLEDLALSSFDPEAQQVFIVLNDPPGRVQDLFATAGLPVPEGPAITPPQALALLAAADDLELLGLETEELVPGILTRGGSEEDALQAMRVADIHTGNARQIRALFTGATIVPA